MYPLCLTGHNTGQETSSRIKLHVFKLTKIVLIPSVGIAPGNRNGDQAELAHLGFP